MNICIMDMFNRFQYPPVCYLMGFLYLVRIILHKSYMLDHRTVLLWVHCTISLNKRVPKFYHFFRKHNQVNRTKMQPYLHNRLVMDYRTMDLTRRVNNRMLRTLDDIENVVNRIKWYVILMAVLIYM